MTATAWRSGDVYEPYVGRWSRLVAREFVPWTGVAPGATWLDVGCGTGALTSAVLELAEPAAVVGVEPSAGFVEYAAAHVADPRAEFRQGDAQALPVADAAFDAAVSGLVLNFVPDRALALREAARAVRSGCVVAAYLWDYAEGMRLMRVFWDTAVELDESARAADEAARFPVCRPEPLRELFGAAGFRDVEVEAITVPTVFRDFDDYWTPFLGGQAPAPAYAMSLPEDRRAALRDAIRDRLPIAADGSIELTARAWAVKARRP